MITDLKREMLRHMVATVAFRGGIAIENVPADFADLRVSESTRSPVEILSHIGDLLIGSRFLLSGEFIEMASKPLSWEHEVSRFFSAVRELDAFLASDQKLSHPVEKMIQGPIGDALTHVGQIVLLRRIAGAPIKQVLYFTEEVVPGAY